jgi:hypothetical protein
MVRFCCRILSSTVVVGKGKFGAECSENLALGLSCSAFKLGAVAGKGGPVLWWITRQELRGVVGLVGLCAGVQQGCPKAMQVRTETADSKPSGCLPGSLARIIITSINRLSYSLLEPVRPHNCFLIC